MLLLDVVQPDIQSTKTPLVYRDLVIEVGGFRANLGGQMPVLTPTEFRPVLELANWRVRPAKPSAIVRWCNPCVAIRVLGMRRVKSSAHVC